MNPPSVDPAVDASYCVAEYLAEKEPGSDQIGRVRSHHPTLHNALLAAWSVHRLDGLPVCVFRVSAGRLHIHWTTGEEGADVPSNTAAHTGQ